MFSQKEKISYGISLCRYNDINEIEILLIKKRYTYYFFNFVFGYYKKNDTKYLKHMFNNMTFSEKIDILSMQFDIMWYRIWLNNPETNFNLCNLYKNKNKIDKDEKNTLNEFDIYNIYQKKKSKFLKLINSDTKKEKLCNLINESTNSELLWEIPKGGQENEENNIDCAVREFYEETSISPKYIQIYYHQKPIVETYTDNFITYKNIYYLAKINNKYKNKVKLKINFNSFEQIKEIESIRWISLNKIKFLKLDEQTHKKTVKLYKRIINLFKKLQKFKKL